MFERDVLPPFLASRRWFAQKDSRHLTTTVHDVIPLAGSETTSLVLVDVQK